MLKLQAREFSCSVSRAASPARGKAQGFAKKVSGGKATAKKITSGTLYKPWQQTVATANLNKSAIPVETPTFKPTEVNSLINKISSFSAKQYKLLYRLGSFKQNQLNELFPRPITLVREDTTNKLFSLLKSSPNRKYLITGESGVGKSVLLSQVHALGVESKGVLINISYPELFLNGRNDFFYDDRWYVQPMYLKKLITKILKSNDHNVLASVKVSNSYKFSNANPKDAATRKFTQIIEGKSTLLDLLSVKTSPRNRGDLFEAIISELASQSNVPVFFTVDNFSRILSEPFSAYKDSQNKNVHVLELQVGKIIMDIVSGKIQFPHSQSCVVMAISGVDRTNKTLPIGLSKLPHDPYCSQRHYDTKLSQLLLEGKVQEFNVNKLSKYEVEQLIDFYIKSEVVLDRDAQGKPFEQLVEEKYFLSGNGNPRELLKSLILQFS